MFFGIDPSTKCGVASVNVVDGKPVLVKTDVIHSLTLKGIQRARAIAQQVEAFVSMARCVDGICMEGYSFGSKTRLVDMVEIGTMVRYWLMERTGHKVVICPPSTLKIGITGKGNAKKPVLILEAYKRWGWELLDDDRCDAACLAVMAACYYGQYPSDAKMRDAVGKISLCV